MKKVLWGLFIAAALVVALGIVGETIMPAAQPNPAHAPVSCAMTGTADMACSMTVPADVAAQPVPADEGAQMTAAWCRSLDARPDRAAWKQRGRVTFTLLAPSGAALYQTTVEPGSCR